MREVKVCKRVREWESVPQTFAQRLGLDVVERQEGLGLEHALLQHLDAAARRLLGVDDDGLHVLAEHLGDGHVVALVRGLAHVDHAVVHAGDVALEVLHDLLLLAAARLLVLVDARVAQLRRHLLQLRLQLGRSPAALAHVRLQLGPQPPLLFQGLLGALDVFVQFLHSLHRLVPFVALIKQID